LHDWLEQSLNVLLNWVAAARDDHRALYRLVLVAGAVLTAVVLVVGVIANVTS
jgi:hypothetical protein